MCEIFLINAHYQCHGSFVIVCWVQHGWIAVCGGIDLPNVARIIDGIYCTDEAVCSEGTYGKNCQESTSSIVLARHLP